MAVVISAEGEEELVLEAPTEMAISGWGDLTRGPNSLKVAAGCQGCQRVTGQILFQIFPSKQEDAALKSGGGDTDRYWMNVTGNVHDFPSSTFTAVDKRHVIQMKDEDYVGGKEMVVLVTTPDNDFTIEMMGDEVFSTREMLCILPILFLQDRG